jgi:hypothetical protein
MLVVRGTLEMSIGLPIDTSSMKDEREERSTETIGVVRCASSAFWDKNKALSIHSATDVDL